MSNPNIAPNLRVGAVSVGAQGVASNLIKSGISVAASSFEALQAAQSMPNTIVHLVGPNPQHGIGFHRGGRRTVPGPYILVKGGPFTGAPGNASSGGGPQVQTSSRSGSLTNVARNLAPGADIARGGSESAASGVPIQGEFNGISTNAASAKIGPTFAEYQVNTDGMRSRGALSKRAGLIPTRPRKDDVLIDWQGANIVAIPPGYFGRSINAFPRGFYEAGDAYVATMFDKSFALGSGASAAVTLLGRAGPSEANYGSVKDIRHVRMALAVTSTVAGNIQFTAEAPAAFLPGLTVNDRISSFTTIVVVASTKGFVRDRDIQDLKKHSRHISNGNYQDFDGKSLVLIDNAASVVLGQTVFYTVFALNDERESLPAFLEVVAT